MFQFRRFPPRSYVFTTQYMTINHVDCSIRKSRGQSLLTTNPSLSQLTTSFIGSQCQGIHPTLLKVSPFNQCPYMSSHWFLKIVVKILHPTLLIFKFVVWYFYNFLIALLLLYSIFKMLLSFLIGNRFQQTFFMFTQIRHRFSLIIIPYLLKFVKSFFDFSQSGHKWTRTTDLTLIRRAL